MPVDSTIVCVNDFEKFAQKNITKSSWDYIKSGANHEQTLEDNCLAFKRYRLRPIVLKDVSRPDLTTSVLGAKLNFPVCVTATGINKLAHFEGEVGVAKGAASVNTGFMLSTWATSSIEEVADATGNSTKWLQLYIFKDRDFTESLVKRATASGYKGIFLTVDTQVIGMRYADMRNQFSRPSFELANLKGLRCSGEVWDEYNPSMQWSDLTWLKSITKLPIVIKGILTSEMAEMAVQHGVDGILVSNHGARQLDGVPATIDALPEVVKAVAGRCEVYLDGGVRCGTDVLKAVALGAKAVFIGRPALWGLAYDGENGVIQVLNILKEEFKIAMQLIGCSSVAELQTHRNLVVPQSFYTSRL